VNLLRWPWSRSLLRSRWPQLTLQLIALAGLAALILIGLVGTPVGNRNLAIVAIWIVWWALLMLLAVPFFGRAWCSICPIPLPGEWLQRGAILSPAVLPKAGHSPRQAVGLGLRWPRRLRNLWLQNAVFVGLALVSLSVLTQPRTTAWVLIVLPAAAVAVSLLFERRSFCRYLCPVGGVIGVYAQASPVEVRVIDAALCAGHSEKTCYVGSSQGYGCPWQVYPAALRSNLSCGTCFECIRTCPYDNVAVNLRPFGDDLRLADRPPLDQSYKSLLLIGSVVVYAAVMLGPWGSLKVAAANVGAPSWFAYAAAFLLVAAVATPRSSGRRPGWAARPPACQGSHSTLRARSPRR
jgi:polyferredoxin